MPPAMPRIKTLLLVLILLGPVAGRTQEPATAATRAQQPIPVIFDTDIGPDYDDVGAITMLQDDGDGLLGARDGGAEYRQEEG